MARASARDFAKRQRKLDDETLKRASKTIQNEAKTKKAAGHIAGAGEIGDTNVKLLRLARAASDLKRRSRRDSRDYKRFDSYYNKAEKSVNDYRKSSLNQISTGGRASSSPSFSAPSHALPLTGKGSYYEKLQGLSNARAEKEAKDKRHDYIQAKYNEDNERRAQLYKYGDVDRMSGKEINDKIRKLEQEKAQRQAEREALTGSSSIAGGGVSQILKGAKALSAAQKDTYDKLDADADDKLMVYRQALPAATLRDEEKKLTRRDKWRIEQVADIVRSNKYAKASDVFNGQANPEVEKEKEARASLDDIRKKGIDVNYLIDTYATLKDNEDAERDRRAYEAFAKENPKTAFALDIITSPARKIQGGIEALSNYTRSLTSDKPIMVNQQNRWLSGADESITKANKEDIEKIENPIFRKLAGIGYDAVKTVGEMGMDLALSAGVGAAAGAGSKLGSRTYQGLMSAGAAETTYNDALERGLDPNHAMATAVMAGVAEWFTEKVSLDNLKVMAHQKPATYKELFKNITKSMVVEGSEEAASDIMNTISDSIINGKKSEFNINVRQYEKMGLAKGDARKAALYDWIKDTGYDALLGAISGGIMGGGAQALSFKQVQDNFNSYGDMVEAAGQTADVVDYAKKFDDLTKDAKKTAAARYTEKGANKAGKLADAVQEKVEAAIDSATNAVELQDIYTDLTEDAPDIVRANIDSKTLEKVQELTNETEDDTENYILSSLADEAQGSYEQKIEALNEKLETSDMTEAESIAARHVESNSAPISASNEIEDKTPARKVEPKIFGNKDAVLTASMEPVQIDGFENIGTKDVKVKIDGGEDAVSLDDLSFKSKNIELLYDSASKMDDSAAASAMISNYDGKMSVATYYEEFEKAYNMGTVGYSFDTLAKKSPFTIPLSTAKLAYMLGENANEKGYINAFNESDMIERGEAGVKKNEGKVIDERRDTEDLEKSAMDEVDEKLAEKLGVNIRRVDIAKNEKGEFDEAINGYLAPSKGEMVFADVCESEFGVRIHETMEFVEAVDPVAYRSMMQAVLSYAADKSDIDSIYNMVMEYREAYREGEGSKTFDEAMGEFVNDAISGVFMNEEGAKDFITWLHSKDITQAQEKSILQTIADIIKSLIEKIKTAFNNPTDAQKVMIDQAADTQAKIRQMFMDAVDRAANKHKEGVQTSEKVAASRAHSFSVNLDGYSEKEIEDRKNAKNTEVCLTEKELLNYAREAKEHPEANKRLLFGKIKEDVADKIKKITGNQVVGYNVSITQGVMVKTYRDHGTEKEKLRGQKPIEAEDFKDFVETMANPDTIRPADKTGPNNETRLLFEKRIDEKTIVVVEIRKKRHDIGAVSMYKGLARPANARSLARTSETRSGTASTNSITPSSKNASEKYNKSLKIKDLSKIGYAEIHRMNDADLDDVYMAAVKDGDEEAQAECVREAAARAGYDSPILYHGTEKTGFTEFDLGKMDDGISIFTTESEDMAAGYSGRKVIKTLEAAKNKKSGEDVFKRGDKKEILQFFKDNLSNDAEYATPMDLKNETKYSSENVKRAILRLEGILKEYAPTSGEYGDTKRVISALKEFEGWYNSKNESQMKKFDLEAAFDKYNKAYDEAPEKVSDVLIKMGLAGELRFIVGKSIDDPEAYISLGDEGRGLIDVDSLTYMSTDPGIYKMYGKTDNMLIVDGKGKNWNEIPLPQAIKNEIGDDEASTRELSKYAKDKGYNGVIINNISDNGGNWSDSRGYSKSTVRIFFNPSDVKSADNVTYDEKGDAMPLSERFNDEKKDLRFSRKVNRKEAEDHAKKAEQHFGTTTKFSHAGYLDINGKLIDFSDGQRYRVRDHREIEEILDMPEDAGYSDSLIQFMNEGNIRMQEYGIDISMMPNEKQEPVLLSFFRKLNGEVTIDFSNEYGDNEDTIDYEEGTPAERILSDIKNFFKQGSLAEQSSVRRFHYSTSINGRMRSLVKDNEHLAKMVEQLGHEFELTGGRKITEKQARSVARSFLKQYNSDYDEDTLTHTISQIYSYLHSEYGNGETALKKMADAARAILENGGDIDEKTRFTDLRDYLKTTGISLTERQKAEVVHAYGSYQAFKSTLKGKVKLNDNGADLERIWNADLQELAPELFPTDTVSEDMPLMLADLVEAIEPRVIAYGSETAEQGAYDVAMQIYEKLAKLKPEETFADKQMEKANKAGEDAANVYHDILESFRKEIDELHTADLNQAKEDFEQEKKVRIAENTSEMKAILEAKKRTNNVKTMAEWEKRYKKLEAENQRLRLAKDDEVAAIRAKYNQRRLADRDQRHATETKNKIRGLHSKFQRMILKPTETAYVPQNLMTAAVAVCNVVNPGYGEGTKLRKALDEARRAFPKVSEENGILASDFDPRIADEIDELANIFDNKPEGWSIKDASLEELNRIYEAMNGVYESIRMSTKLIREQGEKDARAAGKKWMKELEESKGVHTMLGKLSDKITSSFLNSYREFRKLAGYNDNGEIMETWRELNNGYRQTLQVEMEGNDLLADKMGDSKEVLDMLEKLNKDLVKVPLKFKSGSISPVMITRGMRLSLIMHGMSTANMRHMMLGGIEIPADMKIKDKKKAYEHTRNVTGITYSAIKQMEMELTPAEKKILDAAKELFHNWSGEKINETSNKLYGFERARVNNYFPITVDRDYVATDVQALKFDKTIEGAGFLKERIQSNNPIILDNIIDIADKTIKSTAMFNGLAVPIRNFNKILNTGTYELSDADNLDGGEIVNPDGSKKQFYVPTNSVKKELKEKWGMRARNYIDNLIADLQQGRNSEYIWHDKLRSNYAGAVLTANASVIIKQTSAYPTVAGIVGWGPTLKAMLRGGKNNWLLSKADVELINKYTPLYWYRNKGNNSRDLAEIRDMGTVLDKIPVAGKGIKFTRDLIQKVDIAMVGRFWYAAQYWVNKNTNLKKGSDAYYRKVAEIFNRAVEETQSTNMTMANADIMRNPAGGMKMITMFMGQGLQNFGIVYDNLANMRAKRKMLKEGKCTKTEAVQAKKDFINAVSSQLVSAAVFAGLAIVARGLLHKMNPYRDDKQEVTAGNIALKWLDDFGENIFGSIPFGSLIYEFGMATFTDERYYGQKDIVLGAISDLEASTLKLKNAISKGEGIMDAALDMAKDGSKLLGIPFENISNLYEGTIHHIEDISSGEGFLSYSSDKKDVSQNTWTKYLEAAIENHDTEAIEKYIEGIINLGKTEDDVISALSGLLKERDDVKKAAAAKADGDIDTYESIKTTLTREGYPESAVVKAVNTLNKPKKKEEKPDPEQTKARMKEEGSLYEAVLKTENKKAEYSGNDITAAVESGKQSSIDAILKAMIKEKTAKGLSKEDAAKEVKKSVKTALTNAYKTEYNEGGTKKKNEIMKKLSKVKIDNVPIYDSKTFKKWYDDYKKS